VKVSNKEFCFPSPTFSLVGLSQQKLGKVSYIIGISYHTTQPYTSERIMLRPMIILRALATAALFYSLKLVRRQCVFQHYLRDRQITSNDFPASYVKVLNESVARGEQPPMNFDYASTFPESKIPQTIHFIWFQNLYPTNYDSPSQIPSTISRAPELCREFNSDCKINIWNATSARTFLVEEYSWFLPTYDGYRYPIQRIDALKYFVLYHYGGVYMDLDISCRRPLDPLLQFAAWFPKASPLGVNNDLMAAAPKHPVVRQMTMELERYDKNWLFPYLTIFWSTGPQFTSDVLRASFESHKDDSVLVWADGVSLGTFRKSKVLIDCNRRLMFRSKP
jgi:mannosyltransferase OCH1-like enzyme